ncbi:hypothetical protein ACHAXN_001230 [Cyclotella atomus]
MHVTMSQDRIDKLNSIDFVWDVNAHNWNENYLFYRICLRSTGMNMVIALYLMTILFLNPRSRRKDSIELTRPGIALTSSTVLTLFGMCYKRDNGHCKAPHRYPILGLWVSTQRSDRATMSQERIDKLNSIGFDWSVHSTNSWDENYYQCENDHCKVPQSHPIHRTKMSQESIDKLDSIDFIWDVNAHIWNENFDLLEEYKHEYGDCLVPHDHPILGEWVNTQRSNRTKMSQDRIDKLDSIGFVWDVKTDHGNEKYNQLDGYCSSKGVELEFSNLPGFAAVTRQPVQLRRTNSLLHTDNCVMLLPRSSS